MAAEDRRRQTPRRTKLELELAEVTKVDLQAYRQSESERARTADLLRILPRGRTSVLDIGARDGHFSRLLRNRYERVIALDLGMPAFESPGVVSVVGDVTRLPFRDYSFDCVFCAEVLEHVAAVEQACAEIARVTRHEVVIGVPYKQDLRVGRTTCRTCGRINPAWGHVHSFDEHLLARLFPGWRISCTSFVASNSETTTALAAALMDAAGNPWGTYCQEEP
jgi:SAM-dependent methyltransferase